MPFLRPLHTRKKFFLREGLCCRADGARHECIHGAQNSLSLGSVTRRRGGRLGGSASTSLPAGGGIWVKARRPTSDVCVEKEPILAVLLRHATRMKFLVCLSSAHRDMAHWSVNRCARRGGPLYCGSKGEPPSSKCSLLEGILHCCSTWAPGVPVWWSVC